MQIVKHLVGKEIEMAFLHVIKLSFSENVYDPARWLKIFDKTTNIPLVKNRLYRTT